MQQASAASTAYPGLYWRSTLNSTSAHRQKPRIRGAGRTGLLHGIALVRHAGAGACTFFCGNSFAVFRLRALDVYKRQVNTALFDASTAPEEVLRLCAENGIDYLVCSKQYPGDTSQLSGLVVVYENADVTIYAAD